MASTTVHGKATEGLTQAALRAALTQAQAQRLYELGSEVVTMVLPAAAKQIVEQNTRIAEQDARITELEGNGRGARPSPSRPSGMVPIYTKPNTPERRKRPGARQGHPGSGGRHPNGSMNGKPIA